MQILTRVKLVAGGQPPSAVKTIINKLKEFGILFPWLTKEIYSPLYLFGLTYLWWLILFYVFFFLNVLTFATAVITYKHGIYELPNELPNESHYVYC